MMNHFQIWGRARHFPPKFAVEKTGDSWCLLIGTRIELGSYLPQYLITLNSIWVSQQVCLLFHIVRAKDLKLISGLCF